MICLLGPQAFIAHTALIAVPGRSAMVCRMCQGYVASALWRGGYGLELRLFSHHDSAMHVAPALCLVVSGANRAAGHMLLWHTIEQGV